MTITAKFAGRCKNCRGEILIGQKIEWDRSAGAKHVACPTQSERLAGANYRGGRQRGCDGTCSDACFGGCSC